MGNKEATRQLELLCDDLNRDVDDQLQIEEQDEIDKAIKELWSY